MALFELDVRGNLSPNDSELPVLPLVEGGIQDQLAVSTGDFEAARMGRVLAHGEEPPDLVRERELERGMFVDIVERLVLRPDVTVHLERIFLQEETCRVEGIDADIHQRTAARQLVIEPPLVDVGSEFTQHPLTHVPVDVDDVTDEACSK